MGRVAAGLFILPFQYPRVLGLFLQQLEPVLSFVELVSELGVFGQVLGFSRIVDDVVEFEFWSVNVGINTAVTVIGVGAFLKLSLPGGCCPKISGKRVGKWRGDIPDKFVFSPANGAHGVVHLNFVECV